ncbi:MAG: S8 family serine peptidase [Oligoflexales bacterium]|nr:S8 family serine peptidase [Oligoflexales bacterium]
MNSCGSPDEIAVNEPSIEDEIVLNDVILASDLQVRNQEVIPGSYIVVFKNKGTPLTTIKGLSFFQESQFQLLNQFDFLMKQPGISDLSFITSLNLQNPENTYSSKKFKSAKTLQLFWGKDLQDERFYGTMFRVDFTDRGQAAKILRDWEKRGLLWFAEPNYNSKPKDIFADYLESYGGADGLVLTQFWHSSIRLGEAFSYLATQGLGEDILNNPPVIAVMDSGVDYEHPSLKNKIWLNQQVGASSCLGDLHGCNTVRSKKGFLGTGEVWPYGTPGPGECCGAGCNVRPNTKEGTCNHGTHVAGLIAADPAPSSGVGGVCPMCQIMVLRVVNDETGEIPDSAMLNAFKYVSLFQRQGQEVVRVINSSFGKFQRSRAIGLVIRLLKDFGRGVLVVGAAGNEDTSKRAYPAAFNDVLAVSALDGNLKRASYSNFGAWVDVSAPGGDAGGQIISTVAGGNFGEQMGTSQAAPVVAGLAGLILAVNPAYSGQELKNLLITSSDGKIYSEDVAGGYNRNYYVKFAGSDQRQPLLGSGIVDALNALQGERGKSVNTINDFDRVGSGCGVIAHHSNSTTGTIELHWILVLCLILPLLAIIRKNAFLKFVRIYLGRR